MVKIPLPAGSYPTDEHEIINFRHWPGRKINRYGLHFDGENDYVDCGNDASLNMTKELTAIVVVKVKGLTGDYQMFFSKVYNKAWCIGMRPNAESFAYYTRREGADSTDIDFRETPRIGEVQFLAMTYHYQQGKDMYLDGEKISHRNLTGELAISSYDVWIGREATGYYPANADIYFVALYNRALSDAEISQMYDYVVNGEGYLILDGLVLLLDFTEHGSNILYDKSGNNNHGTIYGATWLDEPTGKVDAFVPVVEG